MNWKTNITQHLADVLRFTVRGAILLDAILLALASIYLTVRVCHRALEYCDKVFFSQSW